MLCDVCMYVYYMYICIYVYMYICMYVYMYVCMCVCVYVCMYVCMYVCIYMCIFTYMCICENVYICILYVYILYVYMYTCIYVYMYIVRGLRPHTDSNFPPPANCESAKAPFPLQGTKVNGRTKMELALQTQQVWSNGTKSGGVC